MAFKTLLTHVVADRYCVAHLEMTAEIARALDAKVIGMGAQAPWGRSAWRDSGSWYGERFEQSAQAQIATAKLAFSNGLGGRGLPTEWRQEIDSPNAALVRHAAAADLIVAYRTRRGFDASVHASPEVLALEAGTPVLLLPLRPAAFNPDAVLIAWKNTRETRAAISDAIPVLAAAKRVLVAAVCRADEADAIDRELTDVHERLARQGVSATTLVRTGAPATAGRKLLRIARDETIDLIVAGAYAHSRLREWMLGGVTRDLMRDRSRFVLFGR